MEVPIKEFLSVSYGGDARDYILGSEINRGSGNSLCDGDGSGDGCGYGFYEGCGYGFYEGHGDGSGDSHGYWDSTGIVAINKQKVYVINNTLTLINSIHGNFAKGSILASDLSLTPCYIAKVGDFFAHGDTLRNAFADATAKYEQSLSTEERISIFNMQYSDRDKPIPAIELFNWHNKLTGSCLMGRQRWCKEHNIDLNGTYTVNEFISLTEDAYGGDIIRQLKET